MITCQELTELVTDYLEGKLTFMDRLSFKLHIAMCKHCRAYIEQMECAVHVLGALPEDFAIPDDVKAGLGEAFRDWSGSKSNNQE